MDMVRDDLLICQLRLLHWLLVHVVAFWWVHDVVLDVGLWREHQHSRERLHILGVSPLVLQPIGAAGVRLGEYVPRPVLLLRWSIIFLFRGRASVAVAVAPGLCWRHLVHLMRLLVNIAVVEALEVSLDVLALSVVLGLKPPRQKW
ncbi:hypothetical protein QYE76_024584 [Lolium multiflorum]|uniref:Uncharacterized protein n=1 Tax=Lolium multiflorum TaxID=4521 RepID=A0AAD8VTF0_LOLMU|nr:hypothetical protein QYE76_024584 [Lolium multiflorum]